MKTIQVRHVPDEVHRALKSRAALAGMSLSEYTLGELRRLAELPTMTELLDRLAALPPVDLTVSPAQVVREERDRR